MRWSACVCRYSPTVGGDTDSRELKLVPFVAHTWRTRRGHRRAERRMSKDTSRTKDDVTEEGKASSVSRLIAMS